MHRDFDLDDLGVPTHADVEDSTDPSQDAPAHDASGDSRLAHLRNAYSIYCPTNNRDLIRSRLLKSLRLPQVRVRSLRDIVLGALLVAPSVPGPRTRGGLSSDLLDELYERRKKYWECQLYAHWTRWSASNELCHEMWFRGNDTKYLNDMDIKLFDAAVRRNYRRIAVGGQTHVAVKSRIMMTRKRVYIRYDYRNDNGGTSVFLFEVDRIPHTYGIHRLGVDLPRPMLERLRTPVRAMIERMV